VNREVRAYAEAGKEYATAYGMAEAIKTCKAAEDLMRDHSLQSLSIHRGSTLMTRVPLRFQVNREEARIPWNFGPTEAASAGCVESRSGVT
jgi:hypothetical protein